MVGALHRHRQSLLRRNVLLLTSMCGRADGPFAPGPSFPIEGGMPRLQACGCRLVWRVAWLTRYARREPFSLVVSHCNPFVGPLRPGRSGGGAAFGVGLRPTTGRKTLGVSGRQA